MATPTVKSKIEKPLGRQKGFTFIELAVIIVVIGLLATVATPLYQDMQTQARQNTLRGSLYSMREAINSWASNKAVRTSAFTWPPIDSLRATGMVVMHKIPENPFQSKTNAPDSIVTGVTKGVVVGTRGGWAYKPSTGEIWPNTSSTVTGSGCSGSVALGENNW